MIRKEFAEHHLNDNGKAIAGHVAQLFSDFLTSLEKAMPTNRESSLVKTNLQQAYHWAIESVALHPGHQRLPEDHIPIGGQRHG